MNDLRRLLQGGVDLHCHSAPSPFPRRVDHLQVARHYAASGFRGVVVKSHHHSTAFDVAALQNHGLADLPTTVFGGVALNGPIGGVNPRAVDVALAMGGRVVWLPTTAAARHIEFHRENQDAFPHPEVDLLPEIPVPVMGEDGDLRVETRRVVELVSKADVVLASGHLPPREILAVFEAAVAAGVSRLLLNHPNFIVEASPRDAAHVVDLGGFVEHNLSLYDEDSTFCRWPVEVLAQWITNVGPEQTILASDLGQKDNPMPFDSYMKICGRLLDCGIAEADVRRIVVDNPARLLGLDP